MVISRLNVDKKSFRDKRIETFLLITVAVCCGNVSNLIGRRTKNIPEIIFGVHASSVLTVRFLTWLSGFLTQFNFAGTNVK